MASISSRERRLIMISAPVVVGLLVWGLMPSGPTAKTGALQPKPVAIRNTAEKSQQLVRLVEDQKRLTPVVNSLSYDAPAEELVPQMIRELQRVGLTAGVHIREVKPLRPRLIAGGAGARVPVEVRFRAAFQPDVVRFLYYVEDPSGRMVVDKINITSADDRFRTVDVTAQITVNTRSTVGVSGGAAGENSDVNSQKPGKI